MITYDRPFVIIAQAVDGSRYYITRTNIEGGSTPLDYVVRLMRTCHLEKLAPFQTSDQINLRLIRLAQDGSVERVSGCWRYAGSHQFWKRLEELTS